MRQELRWCAASGLLCAGILLHFGEDGVHLLHVLVAKFLKLEMRLKASSRVHVWDMHLIELLRVPFEGPFLDCALVVLADVHTSIFCVALSSRVQCMACLYCRSCKKL